VVIDTTHFLRHAHTYLIAFLFSRLQCARCRLYHCVALLLHSAPLSLSLLPRPSTFPLCIILGCVKTMPVTSFTEDRCFCYSLFYPCLFYFMPRDAFRLFASPPHLWYFADFKSLYSFVPFSLIMIFIATRVVGKRKTLDRRLEMS
jgi:hypothetical protein